MSTQPVTDAATLRTYVAKLNAAIASGTRSVTLGAESITYNTTDSLIRARNDMRDQLNALERAASDNPRSRQSYVSYDRGYD